MDEQDTRFKQDWGEHLRNKYIIPSETKPLTLEYQTKLAIRRMNKEANREKRSHYVVLENDGNEVDNNRWDQRAKQIQNDCKSLLFFRPDSQDQELALDEYDLIDDICEILKDSEKRAQ